MPHSWWEPWHLNWGAGGATTLGYWEGNRKFIFIAASVDDPTYDPLPSDWEDRLLARIFYDPDPATGIDRSLRSYVQATSSGRASFDADVVGPVECSPCATVEAINKVDNAHLYDMACVVFPSGTHSCGGMAAGPPEFSPPRSPNLLAGRCRVRIDHALGVWVMEILHAVTGMRLGDLYWTNPHPGAFDVMACACGTHPSSHSKQRLGWLGRPIHVLTVQDNALTLHPVGLAQAAPVGRVPGIRVPISSEDRYYIVEARLRNDQYERASPVSSGIPSEGVVIYDVDDRPGGPFLTLKTPTALGAGTTYTADSDGVTVAVDEAVPGGFVVTALSCEVFRRAIASNRSQIALLESLLDTLELIPFPPGIDAPKTRLRRELDRLGDEINQWETRALQAGCTI